MIKTEILKQVSYCCLKIEKRVKFFIKIENCIKLLIIKNWKMYEIVREKIQTSVKFFIQKLRNSYKNWKIFSILFIKYWKFVEFCIKKLKNMENWS